VAAALVTSLSIGAVLGCVNPQKDFDGYVQVASDRRAQSSAGSGGTGGSAGGGQAGDGQGGASTVDLSGKFISYCLSSLGVGDPMKSLLLATEFEQTGSSLSVKLTPLKIGASSLSEILGTATTAKADIASNGFTINFGTVSIPGAANPISGSDIEIANTVFAAKIQSSDHVCAELGGQLTKPFAYPLDDPGDICLILRVNADGSVPPLPKAAEFVCP
jgi:hypothetical protein